MIWLIIKYFTLMCLSMALGWLVAWYRKWSKSRHQPKGMKFDPRENSPVSKDDLYQRERKRTSILRDRYKTDKAAFPNDWDAIVIGSGIGGLGTAAFLSRLGWRVLVLEQHYLAGGSTHAFEDRGYEHETGIHYIGNIKKRQKVLDLITKEPIRWTQMGHERADGQMVYDRVVIDNEEGACNGEESRVDGEQLGPGEIYAFLRLVEGIDKQQFLADYGLTEVESECPILMKVKGSRLTLESLEEGQNHQNLVDLIDFEPSYVDHQFRSGAENWLEDLVQKFPKERNNLENYLKLIRQVAKKDTYFLLKIVRPAWLRRIFQRWFCNDFYRWATVSAAEIINQTTEDPKLRAILGGQFGDYGPPPEQASFMMHASVINHYLEGGYYPVGGSSQFARQIIPVIEQAGGRVLVDKAVKKILVKKSEFEEDCTNNNVQTPYRTYGVEMENGDVISCPVVISGAGLSQTYNKLLSHCPEAVELCGWAKIQKSVNPSTSFFFLFVDIEGSPEEIGLSSANIWCYPNSNYTEMLKEFSKDPFTKPMPLFIASASAKDETWPERYPGKSSVVILTMAEKSWMEEWEAEVKAEDKAGPTKTWEDQRCMHRDGCYKNVKECMARRLLEEGLFRFYPKTRDRVQHYQVGTPLTIQHYLGAPEGQAYGIDSSPQRFGPELAEYLTPETPIKGFYLTGQDICTLGFTGALMGGLLTTHAILGYGSLDDLITGRNLVDDLISYDKSYKVTKTD